MKISSVIDGFFLDKQLKFSKHTVLSYKKTFNTFVKFVGDVEITSIKSSDVKSFLVMLSEEKKLSKRSIYDALIPLSSLWTWAEKELEIPHIIKGRVDRPSFTKGVIQPYTEEEIRLLLREVENYSSLSKRNAAIIYTLLDTGIRAQEICDLTIKDYDSKSGKLFIAHGKGDKQRIVVLGSKTRKKIWKYLADREQLDSSKPLFSTRNGKPINRDNLNRLITTLATRVGVKKANLHRFRHTFAINFLRNGGNVFVLKELLGHSTLEMSSNYASIAEIDIDNASKFSVADNWKL